MKPFGKHLVVKAWVHFNATSKVVEITYKIPFFNECAMPAGQG
jgi:hypothetical protein